MITIDNLTKSYGSRILFENIGFRVNAKERVGLVGRNGHGKTTLFRIITEEEHADSGSVVIPKYYRIGYVRQHLGFTEESLLKECMLGLQEHEKDHNWKAEIILSGLGFSIADMQRHPSEFSGGYQVRLNLAKILVSEPNMLLLDEPTNYLDIVSIRWIERFLLNWAGEVMLITHDRNLMDRIVTHVVGIHRLKARKVTGNTEKYYSLIAKEEEVYENTRLNDERKRKEVEVFINRFRAKARLASMVQSRVKALERKEKKTRLEEIKDLEFSFNFSRFNAKQLMSIDDISFGYEPGNDLIKDFRISIGANDRICIIGKNGKGKTTLLKLIGGYLKPKEGDIHIHPNTLPGIYEQTNVQTLSEKKTVEQEILDSDPGMERQKARNISAAIMFEGDDALKNIGVLSGGEKSRVLLGKIIAKPANLLLLDEPTNHLDMESCDALLAAIDNFEGAVIMVTHNEMFLHALSERLIIFQNGISVYEGNYQEFLDDKGWDDESGLQESSPKSEDQNDKQATASKKEQRRARSEIVKERSKILGPIEKDMKETEAEIERKEKEYELLNQSMIEASHAQDGKKISELSKDLHKYKAEIDRLFGKLDDLTNEFEEKNKFFEERLA
jgi:ATP-binding cassette, subfamily F, member 3